MFGSTIGNIFKITTWGESHGRGVGVVIDGCPAGLPLSEADVQIFLNRRKPASLPIPHREMKPIRWKSSPVFLKERPRGQRFP